MVKYKFQIIPRKGHRTPSLKIPFQIVCFLFVEIYRWSVHCNRVREFFLSEINYQSHARTHVSINLVMIAVIGTKFISKRVKPYQFNNLFPFLSRSRSRRESPLFHSFIALITKWNKIIFPIINVNQIIKLPLWNGLLLNYFIFLFIIFTNSMKYKIESRSFKFKSIGTSGINFSSEF